VALTLARALVLGLGVYVALGAVFALWFVGRGVARVDHEAAGGSFGFRVLIFPGSVALWPLLLVRALRAKGQAPTECNAHRRAAHRGTP
jgi:hypothetical protein